MENYLTEEQFQAACMTWYRNEYREDYRMCFAIDNNPSPRLTKRDHIIEGTRKKTIGIRDGVFDACYIGWGFVAFIDFKLPGNDFSLSQKTFMMQVMARGCQAYKIYPPIQNFKELIWQLNNIGKL